jgi:surfeit locus 1 family protein
MSRRSIIAAVIALIVAVVCVRLGVWQLSRLAERRARNAEIAERIHQAPAALTDLPVDSVPPRFRRVRVSGTFDFEHEIVLTGRSRQGAPGVHIITPLRVGGPGRVVLVNRGWVYAPDAATVDLRRWREPAGATIDGYIEHFATGRSGDPRSRVNPRALRWLGPSAITGLIPYRVAPFYVVALEVGPPRENTPVRLPLPELDDGPHRNYAIQWFAFAVIAVVGGAALVWQDRKGRRRGEQ